MKFYENAEYLREQADPLSAARGIRNAFGIVIVGGAAATLVVINVVNQALKAFS